MRRIVEEFCQDAIDAGVITVPQFVALEYLFSTSDASLHEFVNFLLEYHIGDPHSIQLLMDHITHQAADKAGSAPAESEGDERPATRFRQAREHIHSIDWFCSLAIDSGILTKEDCWALMSDLEGIIDLERFAEAVVLSKLCTNIITVQQLFDEATKRSQGDETPPFSEFTRMIDSIDWSEMKKGGLFKKIS